MNVYVIVEGEKATKDLYEAWIPMVNPSLQKVEFISDINKNNFFLLAGFGYPQYFNVIIDAIEDVNNTPQIDRLIIAVDSEEMTFKEKYQEIQDIVNAHRCRAQVKIIIQHFCLETWALGNRRIMSGNVQNIKLREYKSFFNVYKNDPEYLPAYPKNELNRSQFAFKYLVRLLNEKNNRLSYSKHCSKALQPNYYFEQLVKRLNETGHISSFKTFLEAFQ